jgi:hypothetical protein
MHFREAVRLVLFAVPFSMQVLAADTLQCDVTHVPVVVVLPDGRPILGLKPTDITAEANRVPVTVTGASMDAAARRIVLVMDPDRRLEQGMWDAEVDAARYLLQTVRGQDNLGLVFAHLNRQPIAIGTAPVAIAAELDAVSKERKQKFVASRTVVETIRDAISLFGQPQYGDAMILMAGDADDREGGSTRGGEKAGEVLMEHGIRLFVMQFGMIVAGSYSTAIAPGGPGGFSVHSSSFTNREHVGFVSQTTGGLLQVVGGYDPRHQFELNDAMRQRVEWMVYHEYAYAAQFYDVTVHAKPEQLGKNWKMDLMPAIRVKQPTAELFYPHEVKMCVAP